MLLLLAAPLFLAGQSVFDREVKIIAEEIAAVAKSSLTGHNIAIGDILDADGNAVQLGSLLADEISYALSTSAEPFTIVDRSHFQKLMDEVDLGANGLLDDNTVIRLGRMTGISAIVYGKIYQQADHYRIYFKYCLLEKQTIGALCRGYLTRVPSIDGKYTGTKAKAAPTGSGGSPPQVASSGAYEVFKSGPIQIQLDDCAHASGGVNCTFTVSSSGRNETLILFGEGTYLSQGNRRVGPVGIYLDGRQSTYQLSAPLVAGRPYKALVQFPGRFTNGATLTLRGKTYSIYEFDYHLNNIHFK
ncbi:CsgG/HfaB family protein [Neolewinella lacunae]|uniref:Uncharacterized protein n=1 Tax=Neolewinella lacunae TaxID=1517758 RepID=A0A923PPR6_9BACT|nr:CsgG/HfaB family protein [Neolewinella lacunae]MBC6995163.1 hypothetical protein [Neolewinella lacunae]MDN3634113.1 CsgG/HfaB family protein [Neolewinella lacunae]